LFILFGLDRLGTNWFGFNSVRFISSSGLHWVNKSSGQFGFDSGHIGFRVNSGHYSFGPVRFWVGSISNFRSKSVQLFLVSVRVVRFGSFGSGHFCQIYLWHWMVWTNFLNRFFTTFTRVVFFQICFTWKLASSGSHTCKMLHRTKYIFWYSDFSHPSHIQPKSRENVLTVRREGFWEDG